MKILRFGRLGLPRTLINILFAFFENESSVTSSDFKRVGLSQKRTLERVGITQILTESIQIPYIIFCQYFYWNKTKIIKKK